MDLHLIQRPMNPKRTNHYHYYLSTSTSPIYKKNYFKVTSRQIDPTMTCYKSSLLNFVIDPLKPFGLDQV